MDTLLHRHRDKTVLVLVIFAQLALVAVQVRNDRDIPMIRIWSITAITPLARVLETVRAGTVGFFRNYITMHDTTEENRRLRADLDRLKMENLYLKNELSMADRAKALVAFQQHTPSKTVAARVIATAAGPNSKVVLVDRGSVAGVQKGMGVVTPDGIVGKVIAAYPTGSEVMLATDPEFAAGVVSQKNQVVGTLKGQGQANCKVDYVANEEKVDPGEMFFTSGEDRIFPKGFPVGVARVVRNGSPYKEILVEPTGLEHGLEAVLIILSGVHQAIPEALPANAPVYVGSAPPRPSGETASQPTSPPGTEADKLIQKYKQIGAAENHTYGEGLPGSKPPDFNIKLPAGGQAASPGTSSPAPAPKVAAPSAPAQAKPAVPQPSTISPNRVSPPAAQSKPPAAPTPRSNTPAASGSQPPTPPQDQ